MHHLPRIFAQRRQRKSMDRSNETPSPSQGPKLHRRNAAKNFLYTPSSSLPQSSSSSSSTTSTSSAPRTKSLDLNHTSDRSFRIRGNDGQLDQIFESLGISGPDAFEIPKAAWEDYKSSSDLVRQPKNNLFDEDETESTQNEGVKDPTVMLSDATPCDVQDGLVMEIGKVKYEFENHVLPAMPFNRVVSMGIKGERPSFLTPLPAMSLDSLRMIDNEWSTWELVKGLAPEVRESDLYPVKGDSSEDETAEDIDNHHELAGNSKFKRSDSYSFTSSHEDDSSSTTTDNSPSIRMLHVNITDWQKGRLLGKGSFGTVYEGISRSNGTFFAIKEVSLLEQESQGRESILSLQKEIEMLSQLKHDNIVQYLGTEMDDANLYIFLELMTKGSLASLRPTYIFTDSVVSAYTRQILLGLKYLHSRNIVHRDIKCANILVDSNGTVKLADFGLAKQVAKLNDIKSSRGTALWMAPEVVHRANQGYGTAADIWSLGCTVLEMSTGELPYHPLDSFQALYKIGRGEPPPVRESLSTDLKDFIMKCLQVNPSDRPSAAELLYHSFLKRPLESPAAFGRGSGGWR